MPSCRTRPKAARPPSWFAPVGAWRSRSRFHAVDEGVVQCVREVRAALVPSGAYDQGARRTARAALSGPARTRPPPGTLPRAEGLRQLRRHRSKCAAVRRREEAPAGGRDRDPEGQAHPDPGSIPIEALEARRIGPAQRNLVGAGAAARLDLHPGEHRPRLPGHDVSGCSAARQRFVQLLPVRDVELGGSHVVLLPRELRAPSRDPACQPVRLVAHASVLEDQRSRRLRPPACLGRVIEDDQLVEAAGRLAQRGERLPVPLAHLLRIDPRPVPRTEAMAPQRLLVRLDVAVYPLDVDRPRLGADEVPADAVAGRLRALDQRPRGLVRVGRFDAEVVSLGDRLVDLVGNQRVGAPARMVGVPGGEGAPAWEDCGGTVR